MRTRVRFTGRVQGVGFRATARDCAQRLALAGWVRNEPDGSVLMEAQGDEDTLSRLIVMIRSRMGDKLVCVDRCIIADEDAPTGDQSDALFEILR